MVMPWGWPSKARACTWCARFEDFDNERSLALHRIRQGRSLHLEF